MEAHNDNHPVRFTNSSLKLIDEEEEELIMNKNNSKSRFLEPRGKISPLDKYKRVIYKKNYF